MVWQRITTLSATVEDVAYDEDLAHRIRELLGTEPGVDERQMFGGLAFLVDGHMAVAVSGTGGLMVRVPRDEYPTLLSRRFVEPMTMADREMRGWVLIGADGVRTTRQLRPWVDRGVDFARSLPPKERGYASRRGRRST
ncbi:TfoX N-terminal domain-containing protein [Mycolicibacterium novocastrense]|uniref:TfoX N-terminal domain-containing protein n=1 Tax=Mycolicibacterium novocastrense TaxID=59813 RepID=A0ABQ0KM56_MYCNV|nr:TfoX N-terminal domain-containing protein [Mycolicibacterium novocastrense]